MSIHGGFPPQGVMPPNTHMGHMPTPGPNMHPSGQMHPQMHPGMRGPGMQHPGQNGQMMGHPSMGMTQNGMSAHGGMGHMQPGQHPGMYGGHPQMGHSFQQMPQGGGMTPQQQQHAAIMQQRLRMQQMQQNNPGMMMNEGQGPQMTGHPGMMKAPLPPHQMQQMRVQQVAQQQQMANQSMHGGHPNAMQRQPSVQGLREQGPGGPPQQQHHGQHHPQASMPPPTPHNPQMQRRPPGQPGPPPQHNQQPQQPQPPQQVQQQPPQPLEQQAPPQHTPRSMHTPAPPGSAQPQNQPRPQQGPPQGQPLAQGGGLHVQLGQHQQQHPPQPQQARENEQQQRQNPPNMAQIRASMQVRHEHQRALQMLAQSNNAILAKLQAFCFHFNELAAGLERANLNAWQSLISDYFVPPGSFRMIAYNHADQSSTVELEVGAASLARYFWTFYAMSGVVKMQMALGAGNHQETAKHFRSMSDPFCSFTYTYPDGTCQVANGSVNLQLSLGGEKISSLDFINVSHDEFISRQVLDNMAFEDTKHSPEKSKTSAKHKQLRNGQRIISLANLPHSRCGEYGMPKGVQDFLEKADTISRMRPIMDFHNHRVPSKRPREALDQLLTQPPNQQIGGAETLFAPQPLNGLANPNMQMPMLYGGGQAGMPAQQQPQMNGPVRTPAVNGLPPNGNYFPSPANGHLGLPNHASPHIAHQTPPPGQHHGMQAPPMMVQGSQHGMGHSANGSSNASPNITGKRRRQSLVGKLEAGDDGMGPPPPTGGQNKVKQSPGPGRTNKKQKGS